MVALRDGRKLLGILRSWDQFGMALQDEQLVTWNGVNIWGYSKLGPAVDG